MFNNHLKKWSSSKKDFLLDILSLRSPNELAKGIEQLLHGWDEPFENEQDEEDEEYDDDLGEEI